MRFIRSRRRMKIGIIVLVIVLLLVAVGQRKQQRALRTAPDVLGTQPQVGREIGGGDFEYTINNGTETRKYLIHIPAQYSKEKSTPLVLFFHGGGGHAEQARGAYGWVEKSDKEGFIVVFANGASRFPRGHLATWNAGDCCGYARDNNSDDVGYVKEVIRDVEQKFNIDKEKIFATGMSNGGMMSHRLACEMSDTFRAVASVAGPDGVLSCTPARPISVMHIHAKDDDHVLFDGGAGEGAFRDEDMVANFTSVPDTIAHWVKRNQLVGKPARVLDVAGAYCDLYSSPTGEGEVKLCVTETGGHSWPGAKPVRGKTPSSALSATDAIWDFFKTK
jgi:polyhydroxybutyrate depolymerase